MRGHGAAGFKSLIAAAKTVLEEAQAARRADSHSRRREMLCGFRRDEVKGDMWDEKLGKVTVIEDGCVTERKVG